MKIFWKLLLLGSGLIAILLIFSTFYHIYQLKNEAKKYPPPGKLITVDNNKMHIYSNGKGEISLIFMAVSGTSGPTIDFKPLWKKLLDEYRITVVEKAGYGWSEQSAGSGDIEKLTAVFYKSSLTKNMLKEVDYIERNASRVKRKGIPSDIPMYFFIAKNSDQNIIPNWTAELSKYLNEVKYGKSKILDTGHYVHHEKSDLIDYEIKKFLRDEF